MTTNVDLSGLSVRREDDGNRSTGAPRRRWVFRYGLPALLLIGLIALIGWAAADVLLPSQPVTVVPVVAREARALSVDRPVLPNAWSMTFDATTNATRLLSVFKMLDRFQDAARL